MLYNFCELPSDEDKSSIFLCEVKTSETSELLEHVAVQFATKLLVQQYIPDDTKSCVISFIKHATKSTKTTEVKFIRDNDDEQDIDFTRASRDELKKHPSIKYELIIWRQLAKDVQAQRIFAFECGIADVDKKPILHCLECPISTAKYKQFYCVNEYL